MNSEDQDYGQQQDDQQQDQGQQNDRYSQQNRSRNPENRNNRQQGQQQKKGLGNRVKQAVREKIDPRERIKQLQNPKEIIKKIQKDFFKNIGKQAIKKAALSPHVWIVMGAIALIFLLIMIITGIDEEEESKKCQGAAEISISLTGPAEVKKDDEKEYTITIGNSSGGTTVTLKIPGGMEFVSAENDDKHEGETITWTTGNGDLKFKLKATEDNKFVILIAEASGGEGGGGGESNDVSSNATDDISSNAAGGGMAEVRKIGKQYGKKWEEFLNAAEKVAKEEDYPLAVMIAQAAHEGAHGTSEYARERNNFFGINAVDANPDNATKYPTVEDGVRRYVDFIKNGSRYKEAYAARSDPKKMVELIKKAGYVTDPDYVNKVTNTPEFKALAGEGSGTGGSQTGGGDCGAPQTGGTAEGYVPPSDNNCGGKYQFTSPLKKNFGDPNCKFTKDELNKFLKEKDSANADRWFNKVIPCESKHNPNAYAGPQTGTPDAAGAWGLVQMGSSNPPGQAPPAPGKNGPNDRGDVNWEMQMTNAAAYHKKVGKGYWACK